MHNTSQLVGRVLAVRVGEVRMQHWSGRDISTGAEKQAQQHPVLATPEGLVGDAQGNLKVHGGPDKAICCYPAEFYPQWQAEGIDVPEGAFFENLTLTGLTDDDVHLGDVLTVGSAVVQVTQPRRPCTTVSARWSNRELPRLMQSRGRTGYYLRVLEAGEIKAGDAMVLTERQPASVSVAEVNRVMNVDRLDRAGIRRVLNSPELPDRWRTQLERRLNYGELTDETARLGPAQ